MPFVALKWIRSKNTFVYIYIYIDLPIAYLQTEETQFERKRNAKLFDDKPTKQTYFYVNPKTLYLSSLKALKNE